MLVTMKGGKAGLPEGSPSCVITKFKIIQRPGLPGDILFSEMHKI